MAAINFLLTPTGSALQVVLTSLPILALLCYFVYLAAVRQSEPCYSEVLADDEVEDACRLIPLIYMIYVYLGCAFLFSLVAGVLSLYVPKRRALIEEYLDKGKSIVGDIHYKASKNQGCCRPAYYGYAVYHHPNYEKLPVFIRRQVRVFERYTRENIFLLYLEDKSFSAQPKEELMIDLEIFRKYETRMIVITCYAWVCVAFCYLAPIYILKVIYDLDNAGLSEYQPDYDSTKAALIFAIVAGLVIPIAAFAINWIAWTRHEKWMTRDHRILEEIDPDDAESWYEGTDMERAQYQPPAPVKTKSKSSKTKTSRR